MEHRNKTRWKLLHVETIVRDVNKQHSALGVCILSNAAKALYYKIILYYMSLSPENVRKKLFKNCMEEIKIYSNVFHKGEKEIWWDNYL